MISSVLLKCSGANMDILGLCPKHETTIHAGMGGVIIGTAALAFCSGGFALHTVFGNPWIAIGLGFVWALIIFNLDRYIIATIKKTGKFWIEFQSYLPRIVLAVIIGLTISEPLKLELFKSEINEELNSKLENKKTILSGRFDLQVSELKKADKENFEKRTKRYEETDRRWENDRQIIYAQIAKLEKKIADKDHVKLSRYELYLGECSGRAGTKILGDGPECKRTKKAYEAASEEWNKAININGLKIAELKNEAGQMERRSLAERERATIEWRQEKGLIDEKITAINLKRNAEIKKSESIASEGFLARYIALNDLVKNHPELLAITFAISALFIFMEIAPVLAKALQMEGPYDYILKRMDEDVRAEQLATSKVSKSIMEKEFLEHQWLNKMGEMKYGAVRLLFEKNRIFTDDIIREKSRFDTKISKALLRLKKIKDNNIMQKEKESINSMLKAFYKTENLSFVKFDELLHDYRHRFNSLPVSLM